MLASLIRLRQSIANKGSDCDRGVHEYTITLYFCAEEIPPELSFLLSSHHLIVFQPQMCACIQTRTFLHEHSRTGAQLENPNQTAVSHTVTVATVASSTHSTVCHIWFFFFSFFPRSSLHHTHIRYKQLPDITLLLHADVQLSQDENFTI